MDKNRLLIVVSFLMLMSCENPFLPKTGVPLNVSDPRLTPAGVISQLFSSYESRRIELFTDLLSKDFKFYVASGFDRTNMTYSGKLLSEKPDTFMLFVNTNAFYDYWGYDAEVNSTSKMFHAEMIEIPSRPAISNTHYIFNSSGDTVCAEVKVNDVTFEVSRYENGNVLVTYSLENQPQVFLLERDKDNLWVIKKWYDLGS
jgi:hypothetical protein